MTLKASQQEVPSPTIASPKQVDLAQASEVVHHAEAHDLPVLATIRSVTTAGVPPRIMGIVPVPPTTNALAKAGLKLEDIDLIELNEAFAVQSRAVLREWNISGNDERLNVNAGAIALGHALGCSGARLITTLVHEFEHRSDARYPLATMCNGVGQGIAMLLERVRDEVRP